MAVAQHEPEQKTFVKEFYVNCEDLEKDLNNWLKANAKYYDVDDIVLSSCCIQGIQTKIIALVIYHKR